MPAVHDSGPDNPRDDATSVGVVVAVKDLERAKSRVVLPPSLRRRLVMMMLLDTVSAWRPVADDLVVVSGSPLVGAEMRRAGLTARLLPDPGTGLNNAFTLAAEAVECQRVVASVADLPCLTVDAARAVVAAGGPGERWMVPDTSGHGTTILVADRVPLQPGFEHGSAVRHRNAGARPIEVDPGAHHDVDDLARLEYAVELGVGRYTSSLFVDDDLVVDTRVVTVAAATEAGWELIDDQGRRLDLERDQAPTPRLASGQRLHCTVHEGRVHSVWW